MSRKDKRLNNNLADRFNKIIEEFTLKAKFNPADNDWTEQTKDLINKQRDAWARIRPVKDSQNANLKKVYINTVNTYLTSFILDNKFGCKANNDVILEYLKQKLSPIDAAIEIVKLNKFTV